MKPCTMVTIPNNLPGMDVKYLDWPTKRSMYVYSVEETMGTAAKSTMSTAMESAKASDRFSHRFSHRFSRRL